MSCMTTNKRDIKEAVEIVSWWLDESNAEARRQLREHNEPLAQWLDFVETKVNEKMKQAESEAMAKVDV